MKRRKRGKNRSLEFSKRSLVQRMMASFAITTVVLVTAVGFELSSAKAYFKAFEVIGNAVYYDVEINDEFEMITSGSLKLVLEHPFDRREIEISALSFTGIFEDLRPNTDYQLLVKANQGVGQEVLAKQSFKTDSLPGGKILGVEMIEDPHSHPVSASVNYYINDYLEQFSAYRLRVSFQDGVYEDIYPISIEEDFADILLSCYHSDTVYIYLEGEFEGSWEIFDQTFVVCEGDYPEESKILGVEMIEDPQSPPGSASVNYYINDYLEQFSAYRLRVSFQDGVYEDIYPISIEEDFADILLSCYDQDTVYIYLEGELEGSWEIFDQTFVICEGDYLDDFIDEPYWLNVSFYEDEEDCIEISMSWFDPSLVLTNVRILFVFVEGDYTWIGEYIEIYDSVLVGDLYTYDDLICLYHYQEDYVLIVIADIYLDDDTVLYNQVLYRSLENFEFDYNQLVH